MLFLRNQNIGDLEVLGCQRKLESWNLESSLEVGENQKTWNLEGFGKLEGIRTGDPRSFLKVGGNQNQGTLEVLGKLEEIIKKDLWDLSKPED